MTIKEKGSEDPSVSGTYQYSGYTVLKRKDKIVQVEFAEGFNITLDDARKQVEIFRKLQENEKCVLLAVFKEGASFGKEVREYISSEEVSNVVKADALVIKGLALKILTNGYLKINKPNRPSKVFNSTTNAIKWLHKYL